MLEKGAVMIVIDNNQHVRMNRDFCPIYDDMMICIVTNLIMLVLIKILYNLQRNPMKSTNKDTMRRVDERRTWWHSIMIMVMVTVMYMIIM